jgi:hypothetical protein
MSYRRNELPRRRTRSAVGLSLLVSLLGVLGSLGAPTSQAATLPTLTLSLSPGAISAAGATTQSGAVNVVVTAAKGLHEPTAVLVLLKPGVTPEELTTYLAATKAAARDPNLVARYGSLVTDVETSAGGSSEVQTTLQAGTYVALDIAGSNAASWPHTSFAVKTATSPVALPAAQATESSIEFGFRGPSTLHDGQLVRFENEGFLVHMNIGIPVKSRKAAKRLVKALHTGNEKAAGKLFAGAPVTFVGPISTGGFQQEVITAAPGWYVQTCFMQTEDGRTHTLLGMERIIKIAK